MYLVKCEADYSDEFDVYGFEVMSKKRWEAIKEAIKRINYPVEFYFGTNEGLMPESPKELLSYFTVVEISKEEVEVLKKFFSTYENVYYGVSIAGNIPDKLSNEDRNELFGEEN